MAKIIINQSNFNAGELSPELYGHTNLDRYKSGLKVAQNAVLSPRGPIKKRNGFKYIAETKTSSKESRLIKFQYSQDEAFIVEVGDQYFRFYKNGAQVLSGGSPFEVSTPYLEAELWSLTYVQFTNSIYFAHENYAPRQLTWSGTDTGWTLSTVDFYPPATKEDGYAPSTTITPGATSGSSVNFTAGTGVFLAGDVGRQIHNLTGAGKAAITSVSSTTVAVCDILENFPSTSAISSGNWKMDLSPVASLDFTDTTEGSITSLRSKYISSAKTLPVAISGITQASPGVVTTATHGYTSGDKVILSGVVGMTQVNDRIYSIVVTSSTAFSLRNPDTNGNIDTTNFVAYSSGGYARKILEDVDLDVFRSANVGSYILANDGVMEITSVTSAKEVKVEIQKSLSATDSTSAWSMENPAWSSAYGYPRCVTLHQQRLWFAGTDEDPQTIWASESGIFDGMGIGSEDTAALSLDVSSPQVNQISWMAPVGQALAVGTLGSEMTITSGSSSGPITPSNATQNARSSQGSLVQTPVPYGSELLYVQRSGTKLNSFAYSFDSDSYENNDLLFLASHIADSGIKEIDTAQDPDSQIYGVLNNGYMIVGTYVKNQQVLGWSKWDTDGLFESVATISTGDHDEVWCIVKRTINGSTKRYVERLDYSTGEDNIDGFSDCYSVVSNPKTITAITKANPAVVTSASHGFTNGTSIKIVGVEGMTELNGRTFTVANAATNTFELSGENSTLYTTYSSGGEAFATFSSVSSLSRLEAKTVQVKANGATHPDRTVSSGAISLQAAAYEVTVGLPYTFTATLLPQEFSTGAGSMQAQPQRWVRPILKMYKSAYPLINGEFIPARAPTSRMDSALALFSGDAVYGSFTWQDGTDISITSVLPLPCAILSITGSIDSGII